MKRFGDFTILRTLVPALVLLAGCSGGATPPTGPTPNPDLRLLDIAEAGWKQLKGENGANYRFVVSAGSVLGGPNYETTLKVENDTVVQRDLRIIQVDSDTGETTVTEIWSETGDALGSHDEGAEPVTVDARYTACKAEVGNADPDTDAVDLEFIAPTGYPGRTDVLALCLVLPKDAVYDGGAEVITDLEFLATENS